MEKKPNRFYVYAHYKMGEENIPFYIGKGVHVQLKNEVGYYRAYTTSRRNRLWTNIFNKYGVRVVILHDNIVEKEAFEIETTLIKFWGRINLKTGQLANLTDGGEGESGQVRSEESKEKTRQTLMNHEVKESTRKKIGDKARGRPSPNKGKKQTEEQRKLNSSSHMGIPQSKETRRKQAINHTKYVWSIMNDITGEENEFQTANDIAKFLDITYSQVFDGNRYEVLRKGYRILKRLQ
jgi:hypothetical protein